MNVALLLSCGAFEGYFGRVQGLTRESYLANYRNDWSWYYAAGLLANGIQPLIYIPSLHETGRYDTDVGVPVRFLPLARWYHPFEGVWPKRIARRSPVTLHADDVLNTRAFMAPLRAALREDGIGLLYVQEYWTGRFDHLVTHLDLPVAAADHGGGARGAMTRRKRETFARAAAIYSQTPDECDSVRAHGGDPILLPNGCDTQVFSPDPSIPREKSVLTIARLTNKQKRTSDLIDAMTHLPEDWRLDILGTGPDLAMLQRRAETAGVAGRVNFLGFVGRTELRDRLRRAGVYAMPSENEAVAIAALEAMGCGTPPVLTRIRAFEILVEDGVSGRLVPVGDPAALAQGILDAWDNRAAWGAAAAETVRARFDTRVLYRELARTLRAACAPPPGGGDAAPRPAEAGA